MSSTLSLSCSKKIYELLGETYETENKWFKRDAVVAISDYWVPPLNWTTPEDMKETKPEPYKYPAPSFSETIRLLSKIAEKKEWRDVNLIRIGPDFIENNGKMSGVEAYARDLTSIYMSAPTEEEGMKQVSDYLETLL